MKLVQEIANNLNEGIKDGIMKSVKDDKLKFEKREDSHSSHTLAFSEKNKSWIGYSHRAFAEFKVGDKLFDAKWTGGLEEMELEKLPFTKRGGKVIKNLDQARQAAFNFAEYVS